MTNYNNMKKIREIYGATQEEGCWRKSIDSLPVGNGFHESVEF